MLERYLKKGYSYEDAEILSMTRQERLEYLCPYYDIPVNIQDYNLPDRDCKEIIYDFAAGDYDNPYDENKKTICKVVANHLDIAGFYGNIGYSYTDDGKTVVGRKNAYYSDEELFIMQVKAVRIAQDVHDQVHAENLIKDGMSEYEICKVYFDWMYKTFGFHQPKNGENHGIDKGKQMLFDHPYNCFISEKSACGSRAGAFSLVMHTEGIKCQSINVPGHYMNRVLLDGKEYYLDWANSFRDIKTPEQWLNNTVVNNKRLQPESYYLLPENKCLLF